jgi:hypothetical protein
MITASTQEEYEQVKEKIEAAASRLAGVEQRFHFYEREKAQSVGLIDFSRGKADDGEEG